MMIQCTVVRMCRGLGGPWSWASLERKEAMVPEDYAYRGNRIKMQMAGESTPDVWTVDVTHSDKRKVTRVEVGNLATHGVW